VLLEGGFHFIQINGGGKSRGVCGAHRAKIFASHQKNENRRTFRKDGLSYRR
jgi:hypothetical protein